MPIHPPHLLSQWNLSASDLLGQGMTSAVYALDAARALKLYFGPLDADYQAELQHFYTTLNGYDLPYPVPRIDEFGQREGVGYVIERRLPGAELAQSFAALSQRQRQASLRSFLDALLPLHAIMLPDQPYGEVLGQRWRVQAQSWRGFLAARIHTTLLTSYTDLVADVPMIDRLLERYWGQIARLEEPARQLIHGDYFFGNVLADVEGRLTAVIDFSPLTMIGDPGMDLAGALYFGDAFDYWRAEDREFLRGEIAARYGEAVFERIDLYLIYYCLRFSDCKTFDPRTYAWAVRHLLAFAQKEG